MEVLEIEVGEGPWIWELMYFSLTVSRSYIYAGIPNIG